MKIRLGSTEIGFARYLGLWSAVMAVFAVQAFFNDVSNGMGWSIFDYLRWSMIQWYVWAALAPYVFRFSERHPIQPPLRLRSLGTHLVASVCVTLVAIIIGAMISTLFEPSGFMEQLWQFASKHFAIGMLTYWALVAIQQAVHFQAEKARREVEASRLATELAQSRLQVLKTQLQPHFLFNTLHAIVTLLDEDTLAAEDMLLRLSELLRAFLEDYGGGLPDAPAVPRTGSSGGKPGARGRMTISVLVVDDEPIARHAIVRLLRADPEIELLGECGDGASAVIAIREQSPDLLFLDIQMPAMTGIDVLATLGAADMPATVFVTACEQYAVRAFEANAVDYLVKPFSREHFAGTLQRAKNRLASGGANGPSAEARILQALDALRQRDDYLQRIPVRIDEAVVLIAVDEIVWIKASRNTVLIHLADRTHELRETMATLAARLDPRHFARVHRSAIINVRRVRTIHPWFNGHHVVTMDTGQQLRMSRYQHEAFLRLATTRREV